MSLQDFRGQGSPGDIGTFQSTCSILVYQYTFSGTTYVVAARQADRGWVLVGHGTVASTVWQSAVNAVPNGGLIYGSRGTYVFNATFTVPYNAVTIEGEGRNTTVFQAQAALNTTLLNVSIVAGCVWYFSLRELTIDGNRVNNPAAATSLVFLKIKRSTLSNLRIEGWVETLLSVYGDAEASVTNLFENLIFGDSGNIGIDFATTAADQNILSCNIGTCRIGLYLRTSGFFIDHCYIDQNTEDGIRTENISHTKISDTFIELNSVMGIRLTTPNAATYNAIIIVDSRFYNNGLYDIECNSGGAGCIYANSTITDNTFIGTTANSLVLDGTANQHDFGVFNNCFSGHATPIPTPQNSRFVNNRGYNPLGNIANPYPVAAGNIADAAAAQAFPTSATNYTIINSPKLITIYGGTITSVSIDGVATGQAGAGSFAAYRLEPGQVLNVVWAVQPNSVVYAC